ncbi:hypothetical protein LCGC14_0164740 [marine sediment metagenome]|uniref:DUF2589 domain-containing protein n=1 Tax=marine sediment metagenome TaxID=412755 RepID=A0A0F9UUX1_9ZZZZ
MSWWPWSKKDDDNGGGDSKAAADAGEENPPGVHGLADLARGMQHVAQSTQDILGQHFVNVLNHYFDEESGEPIEKRLRMPSGRVIDIPLIALVPPSTLQLKRLKVRMSVSLEAASVKKHQYDKGMKTVERASIRVKFGPQAEGKDGRKNRKMMDLEMEFEAVEPPEMMRRIQEWFTDMVHPMDETEANEYGIPDRKGPEGTQIMHPGDEPPETHEVQPLDLGSAPPLDLGDSDDGLQKDDVPGGEDKETEPSATKEAIPVIPDPESDPGDDPGPALEPDATDPDPADNGLGDE